MEMDEWIAKAAIWYSGYMHGSFDVAKREVPGFDGNTPLEFSHSKAIEGWIFFINSGGDINPTDNAMAAMAMTTILNSVAEISANKVEEE